MSAAQEARRHVRDLLGEGVAACHEREYAATWSRVTGLPCRTDGVERADVLSMLQRDGARGLSLMLAPGEAGTSRRLFDQSSRMTWRDVEMMDHNTLGGSVVADANETWAVLVGSLDRLRAARAARDSYSIGNGGSGDVWRMVSDDLGPFCCDDAEAFWRWACDGGPLEEAPEMCDGACMDTADAVADHADARAELAEWVEAWNTCRAEGDRAGMEGARAAIDAAAGWVRDTGGAPTVFALGRGAA